MTRAERVDDATLADQVDEVIDETGTIRWSGDQPRRRRAPSPWRLEEGGKIRELDEAEWMEALKNGPKPGQRFHLVPTVDILVGGDMSVLALTPTLAAKLHMVLSRARIADTELMLLTDALAGKVGMR